MSPKRLLSYDEVKGTRDARRETKDAMRTPLKKVNEKRKGERFPELRDPDRLAWTRRRPCVISHVRTGEKLVAPNGSYRYATIEASHMRSRGAAGDDSSVLPVERQYHAEQHRIGIKTWAKKYNLDIPALIAVHRKRYALEMADKARSTTKGNG